MKTELNQKIIPCLWFDDKAEEAAIFYTSLFSNSSLGKITRYGKEGFESHGQPEGKVMTVEFELEEYRFVGLNGGPHFTFTPAISFSVVCETESEIDKLWSALLMEGGNALMDLDRYEWSDKYGWVQDRYGLSWQISLGKREDVGQKITPSLMYVTDRGKAEEAIKFYTSIFSDSGITNILYYGKSEDQPEGMVKHAQFQLNGEVFMAMDSSPRHATFAFNEAISLMVNCENQQEVNYFWNKLIQEGDPGAQQCGWLKDKFGLSWQVVPTQLHQMLLDPDPDKVAMVTKEFLQMKKIDIEKLQDVYQSV